METAYSQSSLCLGRFGGRCGGIYNYRAGGGRRETALVTGHIVDRVRCDEGSIDDDIADKCAVEERLDAQILKL